MFREARLKLTAWYLLIIMAISLSFSVFIYRGVTREFQRRLHTIERRLDLGRFGFRPPHGQTEFFILDLEEARRRILLILVYTNGAILMFSAAAGYFLAGKTLAPIEEAMEEQKRFVADASHELKTPLTALQTSIEVALRDKKLKLEDAKSVLKGSLHDIGGLKKLANDLLFMARYQQDNNLVKEDLDVKEVIDASYRKIAPLAREKGVRIIVNSVSCKILGNKESLEKLMAILLDNAVKYTDKGGKVFISMRREKRFIIIEVKDTGIGISKEDLPHIFDRFYRADISRSKNDEAGFGLGLSMAKEIVELHGGSIDVSSTPDKGSVFTVKLPESIS